MRFVMMGIPFSLTDAQITADELKKVLVATQRLISKKKQDPSIY
jgi:hypothetical protein